MATRPRTSVYLNKETRQLLDNLGWTAGQLLELGVAVHETVGKSGLTYAALLQLGVERLHELGGRDAYLRRQAGLAAQALELERLLNDTST